jgi:hypothetical protein
MRHQVLHGWKVFRRPHAGERGSVTTELALALPSVVLLLSVVLAASGVATGHLRCVDAARTGARAAARGEPVDVVVDAVRQVGPSGSRVDVREQGEHVSVEVFARVDLLLPGRPSVRVRSRAVARREYP